MKTLKEKMKTGSRTGKPGAVVVGALVVLILSFASPAVAVNSDSLGCTGAGMNVMVTFAPTGPYLDGDTVDYTVTLEVEAPMCNVEDVTVFFRQPSGGGQPPSCCDPNSGIMIASGLTLVQGDPPVVLRSPNHPGLSYVVNHTDEDPVGLITACVCVHGVAQTLIPQDVQDERTISGLVIHPEIEISKVVDPQIICEGKETQVTYTYAVTNTGDVEIEDVTVTDDNCGPVIYVGGDADGNGRLDPGETWTYECATTISEETVNTAAVTGQDVILGTYVTDTTQATVEAIPGTVCGIPEPDPFPDCCSTGNPLTVTVSDGTPPYSYAWTVAGDAGWMIVAGADTDTITYDTGLPGSSATFALEVTDATGCMTTCSVLLTCNLRLGSVSGTVTDGNGVPIPDLWISASPYDVNSGYWGNSGYTDSNGDYEIDDLPGGTYRVDVYTVGTDYVAEYYDDQLNYYDATPVSVVEGQLTSGIDFQLTIGGSISGTVTDANDEPIPDLWVSASNWDVNSGYWGSSGQTDANGDYEIKGLATVELSLTRMMSRFQTCGSLLLTLMTPT
jgi:hypothetical protein